MTDVVLDARVTALEENSGGNSQNGNSLKIFRSNASQRFEMLRANLFIKRFMIKK